MAGLGPPGHTNGKGRRAKFADPGGLAVDDSGRVYISDAGNHVIRSMTPDGVVSTYAGSPTNGGPANSGYVDGPCTEAKFCHPWGLAVDSQTNVYVADLGNSVIRKITPGGVVSTFAGKPTERGLKDDENISECFNEPVTLTFDNQGDLLVADNQDNVIRRVTPMGVISTLVGNKKRRGHVNGSWENALLEYPRAVAVGTSNIVYFSETSSCGIRMFGENREVSWFVGGSNYTTRISDGKGCAAVFGLISGISVDTKGNLFVAERAPRRIRKVTPDGVVRTIGGGLQSQHDVEWTLMSMGRYSRDGVGGKARFSSPGGIAVDKQGNVYVADSDDNTIRVGRPIER